SDDICEVTEVRINPCKDGRFCRLTKGEESSIEFDFIPKFNASNLTTGLYWAALKRDVPFVDFPEVNACLLTSCPTVAGSKQQLSYTTRLSETLPTVSITIKTEKKIAFIALTVKENIVRKPAPVRVSHVVLKSVCNLD
ncbi:jg23164, partial [Pararge aegeria aegeria]